MKNFTFTVLAFVGFGYLASAQKFTILPQVGLENMVTKVGYNNLPAFKPLQSQASPTLGVRMDYKLKKAYGLFAGVSTSRPTVSYSFANPETGMQAYSASLGNMQLQLQAGLMTTTKPIYFKKSSAVKAAPEIPVKSSYGRCGSYKARSHCGAKNKSQANKTPENKSWFVRIMPSAGLAFNPLTKAGVASEMQSGRASTITYNAGAYKTALLAGVGFEFGSKAQRHFTVNINYFKGLGNNAGSITTDANSIKSVTTNLSSTVSGWNATLGIPFSFGKKPAVKQIEYKKYEYRSYRSGCSRRVI